MNKIISLPTVVAGILILLCMIGAVFLSTVPSHKPYRPNAEKLDKPFPDTSTEIVNDLPFHHGDNVDVISGFYKGSYGNIVDIVNDSVFVCELADKNRPDPECPGWFSVMRQKINAKDLAKSQKNYNNPFTSEELKAAGKCDG